ncbi:MAG TPA: 3-dehydroquinate synthase II [Mariprofundaceae bacterium]|nr:3-dehydroquinate synthase II [Mariprofundaceae bacterium]
MRKRFWVAIDPVDPELVTAAIEAGADAVVVPDGAGESVRRLGRIPTIADDGDLVWGRDVLRVRIASREDEAEVDGRLPTVIENDDWTIIPLENLISRAAGNLIQTVHSSEEAKIALQVMERGADGILLQSRDPAEIRRCGALVAHAAMERVSLEPVRIVSVKPVAMSDRCCIDTTSILPPGEGLLVGNAAAAMFLVHNENIDSPYADARPFRVNAGAVHAYVRLPGNRTRYLSELTTGDELLVCNPAGETRVVAVGRNKIERRPMLLVTAESESGRQLSLVLQNAETVRLTAPEGEAVAVTGLKAGDAVLACLGKKSGRHFGQEIEETIREH